jgi:hypothetical protein
MNKKIFYSHIYKTQNNFFTKMAQNSEAYQKKLEYQKRKSKYIRHLYPNKRLEQNEKSKLRGQQMRWKTFLENHNTVRLLESNNMPVPKYLQNLKEPREYNSELTTVLACPPGCFLCLEARNFLGLTENNVIKRICPENCGICVMNNHI